MCACVSTTKSRGGSWRTRSAGATNRWGPNVTTPARMPTRASSAGSVTIQTPKKFISSVECPSHAIVRSSSRHVDGSGTCGAGAIGRRYPSLTRRQCLASCSRPRQRFTEWFTSAAGALIHLHAVVRAAVRSAALGARPALVAVPVLLLPPRLLLVAPARHVAIAAHTLIASAIAALLLIAIHFSHDCLLVDRLRMRLQYNLDASFFVVA